MDTLEMFQIYKATALGIQINDRSTVGSNILFDTVLSHVKPGRQPWNPGINNMWAIKGSSLFNSPPSDTTPGPSHSFTGIFKFVSTDTHFLVGHSHTTNIFDVLRFYRTRTADRRHLEGGRFPHSKYRIWLQGPTVWFWDTSVRGTTTLKTGKTSTIQ